MGADLYVPRLIPFAVLNGADQNVSETEGRHERHAKDDAGNDRRTEPPSKNDLLFDRLDGNTGGHGTNPAPGDAGRVKDRFGRGRRLLAVLLLVVV